MSRLSAACQLSTLSNRSTVYTSLRGVVEMRSARDVRSGFLAESSGQGFSDNIADAQHAVFSLTNKGLVEIRPHVKVDLGPA
jgi:hypothetical protein